MTRVAALDFGTTRIKGGQLDAAGRLVGIVSRDSPPLTGPGPRRESSPEAYLEAATALRDSLRQRAAGPLQIGVASQRSSFTIWRTGTGESVVPLISWQDRRAAGWCAGHRGDETWVRRITGLPLSPHYAGPKLSMLLAEGPALHAGLAAGTLKFGTLESWVVWHWSGGATHETDTTMAARTLLADPRRAGWHPGLLALFNVPAAGLPTQVASCGRQTGIAGDSYVRATVGDQNAALLATVGESTAACLVNLGTGGFVLWPTGRTMRRAAGYLTGPVVDTGATRLYALEGTINGGASAMDRCAPPPTDLPPRDPSPRAFALPDDAGVGSPFWRADRSLRLSSEAESLDPAGQRRTLAEGLVFRVRGILDDLAGEHPRRVLLSGGLARDPFFGAALAACLDHPVDVLEEGEQTLRGAAWLAAGRPAGTGPAPSRRVAPSPHHAWLRDKYARWRPWLQRVLE